MKIEKFWKIIDSANSVGPDMVGRFNRLTLELHKLDSDDIKSFHIHLFNSFKKLWNWNLLAATHIIFGELVSPRATSFFFNILFAGKSMFDLALKSPDQLAAFDHEQIHKVGDKRAGIAMAIYNIKTGVTLPLGFPTKEDVKGVRIDPKHYPKLFPLLTAKYKKAKNKSDPFKLLPWNIEPDPEYTLRQIEAEKQFIKQLKLGHGALKKRKFDEAIEIFTEIIDSAPNRAEAYKLRGDAKFAQKSYAEAIVDYNEAIKLIPEYVETYEKRSEAKRQLIDDEGAILDRETAKSIKKQKTKRPAIVAANEPGAALIRSNCQECWIDLERNDQIPPAQFVLTFTFEASTLKNLKALATWLKERKRLDTTAPTKEIVSEKPVWSVKCIAKVTVASLAQLVSTAVGIADAGLENNCDMRFTVVLASGTVSGGEGDYQGEPG